ncbi:MAG: hypothetical protein WEC59_06000, partial [Salibacteraceae bacterium]
MKKYSVIITSSIISALFILVTGWISFGNAMSVAFEFAFIFHLIPFGIGFTGGASIIIYLYYLLLWVGLSLLISPIVKTFYSSKNKTRFLTFSTTPLILVTIIVVYIDYSKNKDRELIQEIRKFGVCGFLQTDLDRQDNVFGGTFGMSTPNWQMKLTTEWAGYKKALSGPCRNIPSEIDISEDIEFYKEETCIESSDHDFEMCFRNYRGYLFSSIALIDSYINRHIILFDFNGLKTNEFNQLKSSRNSEERIELFINQFCNFSFNDFKQSAAWRDFKKLKELRNEMVHSLNPYMGLEIKEIAN